MPSSRHPSTWQVSGMGVRPILERSGLPVDTLRQVWNLSDIDRDGQLDSDEFAVAMHLTRECGGTAKVTPDPIGHGQRCPGSRRPMRPAAAPRARPPAQGYPPRLDAEEITAASWCLPQRRRRLCLLSAALSGLAGAPLARPCLPRCRPTSSPPARGDRAAGWVQAGCIGHRCSRTPLLPARGDRRAGGHALRRVGRMCVRCVAAGEEGARGVRTPECLTSASSSFGPGRRPGRGPTEPYGGPGRPVHCVLWLPFVGTGPYVFTESVRFWFGCADLLVVRCGI